MAQRVAPQSWLSVTPEPERELPAALATLRCGGVPSAAAVGEERGGRLRAETVAHIRQEAIAARLQGGRFAPEYGGQGWSMVEWFLVNEQFGRVTNGLHWHVPNAYNVLTQGTPEQVDRYLRPIL